MSNASNRALVSPFFLPIFLTSVFPHYNTVLKLFYGLRGDSYQRLCKQAGITDARPGPHTFRHTAAISCLRNGMGEFALQVMLGHSTLTMTSRYVSEINSEDMYRAHEKASPVDNMRLR